jgi:predicted DNA-binding protein
MPAIAPTEEHRQVQMSVRLPADLAEALETVAEQEDRTVSAELRRIIRRHVAEALKEAVH